jgi:tetratricopeptide (TPR) repeat protein
MKVNSPAPAFPAGVVALMLAALTIVVFWPAADCELLSYDDPDYFSFNPHVLGGLSWQGIRWALTTGCAANWHPVTWLSLMLDAQMFGPDAAGPHVMNLVLHAANAALLFGLLRRLTGDLWQSVFVAGLFALHPLHVESVAWVSERKDVLSGFFFLLTLGAYARYAGLNTAPGDSRPEIGGAAAGTSPQRVTKSTPHVSRATPRAWVYYGLAIALFALGLMSKPMLVTLPFVLLLLDYWPLRRWGGACRTSGAELGRLVWEKSPFFLLATASCWATVSMQRAGGALPSLAKLGMAARIENGFVACARYLGKTFWPVDLAVFYPHPGRWPDGEVALAAALVAILCLGCLWLGRRLPFLVTGWCWFLGMLVPTLGLIQVGGQSMADRYTYLPLIGVFIVLAWGAGAALVRWPVLKAVIGTAAMLVLAACAARTRDQLHYWQNSERLFRHAIAVTQNNCLSYGNLGDVLLRAGQNAEAITNYGKALEISSEQPGVRLGLGQALMAMGKPDQAIAHFEQALQLEPKNVRAHLGLADALSALGRTQEAITEYRLTLQLAPDWTPALFDLGCALAQTGQIEDAIANFRKVIELNPDSGVARNHLGQALAVKGRTDEAIEQFNAVLRLDPNNVAAHSNLGDALASQGKWEAACAHYREALKVTPAVGLLHRKLGNALARLGKRTEAGEELHEALRLDPKDNEAQEALRDLEIQR